MRQNYFNEIKASMLNIMLLTGKRLGLTIATHYCELYDIDTKEIYLTATTDKKLRDKLTVEELIIMSEGSEDEPEEIDILSEFEDID